MSSRHTTDVQRDLVGKGRIKINPIIELRRLDERMKGWMRQVDKLWERKSVERDF